ncbi:putative eukaryotic mitochondrial regulator protein [Elsinoe fawcettii]|nr:putative eukaryotic mitochondrial regulator protein [Elsinoe fawcettii]
MALQAQRHLLPRSSLPPLCATCTRFFSTTPVQRNDDPQRVRSKKTPTRLRRRMYGWLNGPGRAFFAPLPGSTNYLGAYTANGQLRRDRSKRTTSEDDEGQDSAAAAQPKGQEGEGEGEQQGKDEDGLGPEKEEDLRPYPLNKNFVSQPVLSEEMRDIIWRKVVEEKMSVSAVSVELGVDMRRVGAVVRLKEVERKWQTEGKQFATAYASAVMNMLPQTRYDAQAQQPHESINDLPVHAATQQQIFYPTSESRQFTRADAASVFSPTLLPADARIPHPELIEAAKPEHADLKPAQRAKIAERAREALAQAKVEQAKKREEWEKRNVQVVQRPKWDFKFETIQADKVGRNERHPQGVGWRYGMPHEDRKRGHVKDIPQQVVT